MSLWGLLSLYDNAPFNHSCSTNCLYLSYHHILSPLPWRASMGLMRTIQLGLSALKSLPLCTLFSCESLCRLPATARSCFSDELTYGYSNMFVIKSHLIAMLLGKNNSSRFLRQRWLMTSRKQCLSYVTGMTHIWTHGDCGSLYKTSTGSNQRVIALRRGNSHKLILPSRKLFSVNSCWQWENQSSAKECHKVYQPYSRTGPVLGVVGYNRKWIFWGVFLLLFLSFV